MRALSVLAVCALLMAAPQAQADEGMWLYNAFPSAAVKAKYGFEPTPDFLKHLQLSSVRIAGGCSASIVSKDGLVMTNHHCARGCIQQLSTPKKDLTKLGYLAQTPAQEIKCPTMELNQLVAITDVTARVQEATAQVPEGKFADAQRARIAEIEKECATSDDLRCDVVTLYRGGRYDLYTYQRYQDVRLVWAPEEAIAFFGGDPDNFNFPRYDLDASFVRIYGKDGKPAPMEHHFTFSPAGSKDGDLAFVSGNPGGTSRGMTVAQLSSDRDVRLPKSLIRLAELRGLLTEYQNRGTEQRRHSQDMLFGVENGLKAYTGRHGALADPAFFGRLAKEEASFRAKVDGNAEWKKKFGGAWAGIATAVDRSKALSKEYGALEHGLSSDLLRHAKLLLRAGDELPKPNGERLKEFTESRLASLKMAVGAKTPIYPEFEILRLTWSLTKLREELSPDHPVVQRLLGMKSPEDVARALVKGSRLADPKLRLKLFEGGKATVDAAKDPMIEFVRLFDAEARAVRKQVEDEVEGPAKKNAELIAQARFAVYGQSIYPDATFTLRLSYGRVQGWKEDGKELPPYTTLGGAFTRHTGRDPFALPASWLKAKAKLNLETPFNLVTTNDIIGGNSGSPLINAQGEIIGLVFDGNIHSLGGEYGFEPATNRAVSVDSRAIVEALGTVYGAKRLVEELMGPAAAPRAGQP